ncbi:hypothetical protein M8J76_011684 [Diaphorina citri]|nr:hypothetical protein M8J76_011684 [Diaphorina citri]
MKNLHDEIDQLRSANRDLQFQIVLLQQNQERSENRDCGSNSFELDCHSRQCILRMKCERCQNYTPVRVTNLKPNSRMKSSHDNDNCSLQNDNLSNQTNQNSTESIEPHLLVPHTLSRLSRLCSTTNHDKENQNSTLNQKRENQGHYSTNNQNIRRDNQTSPVFSQTLDLSMHQHSISDPDTRLKPIPGPIVHKTYVLSIEDSDPRTNKKKTQKTIVWSKRQSLNSTYETDGVKTSEPHCILPPLQNWKESGCTSTVKKIRSPNTTTPTLPQIVFKK